MRKYHFMWPNITDQQFVECLNEMSRYLLHSTEEIPTQLDQDEIMEILDQAKFSEWHAAFFFACVSIVENCEDALTSSVGVGKTKKLLPKCGVISVAIIATLWPST
jgi:hypothetical protein